VVLTAASCAAVLATWAPFSAREAQAKAMDQANAQLRTLEAENATLAKQNTSLQSSSVIAQVARKAYGLVQPGQSLYVILPPAAKVASNGGQEAFAGDPGLQPLVPPNQAGLVEGGAPSMAPSAPNVTHVAPSLLSRVLRSLQFWR
jgi:cell division protein FtsL